MFKHLPLVVGSLLMCATASAQDIKSGPAAGDVPALKVSDVTGFNSGSDVDYAAERKEQPTVYLFVQADKFDRPVARFMKELDKGLSGDAYIVAVWLTDDAEKSKAYLPKAQQSLNLGRTALTVFTGDKTGPENWNIDDRAHITAVVAAKGKAVENFAFVSVNETDVPKVKESLEKAVK